MKAVSGLNLERLSGPIADEMTTMLDANTQAQIWRAVLDHARRHNVGVLAISHEQALLARICDRVLTLSTTQEVDDTLSLVLESRDGAEGGCPHRRVDAGDHTDDDGE